MAALVPGCVKTQKRAHVVRFKLDRISGEVGFHWKGVIGSEASQMPNSVHLILTSTIAFFKLMPSFYTGWFVSDFNE